LTISFFQDIPEEIVVFIKGGKIVMLAAMDADEGNFTGVDLLQRFAVTYRNKPVFSAMKDIGVASYFGDPFIRSQLKTQNNANGKNRKKPFQDPGKIKVRGVEDQIAGVVIGSQFGSKSTAQAAAINDQVVFGIPLFQLIINELHITQHFFFASFAGAFSKSPVIYQPHIIIIAIKIFGIPGPAFDTPGVSMKVENKPFWIFPVKMKTVDPDTGLNIKKIFFERDIILELEILFQFFRLKDQFFLEKINKNGEHNNTDDNIPDERQDNR
jgi:hypothetical protein